MPATALYRRLVRSDGSASGIEEAARPHVAGNGLRQIGAQALQGMGDQVVNAKTVLPWLLTTLGAPGAMLALLVPVRESGSMLPQAALAPRVRRLRVRKWVWVAGAAGQAFATAAMALLAATATGWAAGLGIVAALAGFALARALTSIASKDVLGRTVPKGERGQINGTVTVVSGAVALTLGLGLRLPGGDGLGAGVLAALLAAASLAWVAGLVVYAGVREPAGEAAPTDGDEGWVRASWDLLRSDATFRRFVTVRALLLVSALSPPFVVAIGVENGGSGLGGLGLFVIAQGIASLAGGRVFGRWADRSSRSVMVVCSAVASAVIVAFLLLLPLPAFRGSDWFYPATYLLLALVHIGARVARKTYVVDVAEGDRRTEYVAVANTAMGVLLLVVGAVTGALAGLGNEWALVSLAVLGLAGAALGRALPEVGTGSADATR